jgi:multidrug efflux pump subunit AcrA (membrane-fusion protein)
MSPTSTGTVVPMPHMGVSIEEGTITVWQVAVGDAVAEGDVLCEIATDKVDMEVETPRRRPSLARAGRLRASPRERPAGATRMGASILLRPPTR